MVMQRGRPPPSVKKEVKPRHLDVSELQRTLSEQEALVEPEVLLQIRGRYRYDLGDLFSYSDNHSSGDGEKSIS